MMGGLGAPPNPLGVGDDGGAEGPPKPPGPVWGDGLGFKD